MSVLPINVEDLLHAQGVESSRIEFKAAWDENLAGPQIIKTICAFANDLQNLNGGYVVVGVAEHNGQAVLPPVGIDPGKLDSVQKWIRGHCNQIDPVYQPVLSSERIGDKWLLVIWVPGSDVRPHRAPNDRGNDEGRKFFVRIGSESVDAERNGMLPQLMQMTARVPFDDRRSLNVVTEDMRESKAREFLREIRSDLYLENNTREMYRKMRIAVPVNGHDAPKNIGLLFFSDNPERWFPGARIEVVHFADSTSGNIQEEKIFRGGIHEQLKDALVYLSGLLSAAHLAKSNHTFRVRGWVSFPIPALREALVNAVYHRDYEASQEPVKVYLYADRMEIISYPGPVPGINKEQLLPGGHLSPVPARNRRIGEFLKELRLAEGRGTGLPKIFRVMQENGSDAPSFDFDEVRSYFRVTLPAHPEYLAISALRDAAHLKAIGNGTAAYSRVAEAWKSLPTSPTLAAEHIRDLCARDAWSEARAVWETFTSRAPVLHHPFVNNVYADVLLGADRQQEAQDVLKKQSLLLAGQDAIDSAILQRRLGNQQLAHQYFERAGDAVLNDARAAHEFAQTKIRLGAEARHNQLGQTTNRRLLREACELLERVIQLTPDETRQAYAWHDLGSVAKWLNFPNGEVEAAYRKASELRPDVLAFKRDWEQYL